MQKKMLIIPGYKLFPAATGGSYYSLAYLEKQMHDFDISIIITPENISEENLEEFRNRFPALNVIKARFSNKGGVNKITKGILKLFRKIKNGNWPAKLRKIPKVSEMVIKDAQLVEEISLIAANGNYDIIQTEHVINLPLISQLPVQSLKIFVHYEVFYARALQDMESLYYKPAYAGYINEIIKAIEVSCLNKFDGVITLSEYDNELLQQAGVTAPIRASHCLAIKATDLHKTFLPAAPPHLLFLGSENHFPNRDGLSWFLQEIFPEVIKQKPQVKLMVTGEWSNEFKEQFKHLPVSFTGFVESLDELLSTGILVAPIRIGAGGIHIKIISAMTKGTPVVSTFTGASGIPHIMHGHDIYITDISSQFAAYLLELLEKPELRQKLSDNIFATAVKISEHGDFAAERNADYEFFEATRNSKKGKQAV